MTLRQASTAAAMPNLAGPDGAAVACPACNAPGQWRARGRAMARQQSTLQRWDCVACGAGVFVKLPRSARGVDDMREQARAEYRGLCELHAAFPQDAAVGTLIPVACLEFSGGAVLVTRAFAGVDLLRCARRRDAAGRVALFTNAGALLRRLHDCAPHGVRMQPIAVVEKLGYVTETYGTVLRQRAATRDLLGQLERAGDALRDVPVRSAWSHGDFKPENVLCDGRRQVVLDTHLAFEGAVVFDIASFLNHVRLGLSHAFAVQADAAFLSGYGLGDPGALRALHWAQLYFMLVYLGRDCRRGGLAGIRARWRMLPLARQLAAAL